MHIKACNCQDMFSLKYKGKKKKINDLNIEFLSSNYIIEKNLNSIK